MDVTKEHEDKMEGWLFQIRANRFCMHNIRKRYFVLEDFYLQSFKSNPRSNNELPIGNAIIDSCIRVINNGKSNIHNKAFFFFTIYLSSNHKERLKLGATSPEEAGRWICSLKDTASKKQCPHNGKKVAHFLDSKWKSFKMDRPRRTRSSSSIECFPCSATQMEAFTSHVNTLSSWKIIDCVNGLRIFREARRGIRQQLCNGHPAIMAVGVVDGTTEAIFHTLMSLGSSRSEWDFCFYKGAIIEHLDDHTDIIHKQLDREWLPWGMKPRDLLLCRHWRKDDNGTYVILNSSVIHKKCPPQSNCIRAFVRSGGYLITPTNQGKQSVVRYMIAIDWKSWRSQFLSSISRSITINMLERIAALRELFREKSGSINSGFYEELIADIGIPEVETKANNESQANGPITDDVTQRKNLVKDGAQRSILTRSASLSNLDDESDKFFDVPEPMSFHNFEKERPSNSSELDSEFLQTRMPGGGMKKLQDPSAQKVEEFQEGARVEDICKYGTTLPMDSTSNLSCTCTTADPSLFMLRGENYLRTQQKIRAKETLMQLVGADWLKSDKRQDDLARRPGSIVQKYAEQGGSEFFIVINMQVPGATTYNLAMYYLTKAPLEENSLLERFVNGDDAFRNSRFKLTPYISKGSWIVKQSVRKKPCLLCKALEVQYFRGRNYLEMAVDVGSSKVARSVVNLVLGYVSNLVIELAFVIQGNTEEELPECLLGTCRLNRLDTADAIALRP